MFKVYLLTCRKGRPLICFLKQLFYFLYPTYRYDFHLVVISVELCDPKKSVIKLFFILICYLKILPRDKTFRILLSQKHFVDPL